MAYTKLWVAVSMPSNVYVRVGVMVGSSRAVIVTDCEKVSLAVTEGDRLSDKETVNVSAGESVNSSLDSVPVAVSVCVIATSVSVTVADWLTVTWA